MDVEVQILTQISRNAIRALHNASRNIWRSKAQSPLSTEYMDAANIEISPEDSERSIKSLMQP
jgi:hypothetical protein